MPNVYLPEKDVNLVFPEGMAPEEMQSAIFTQFPDLKPDPATITTGNSAGGIATPQNPGMALDFRQAPRFGMLPTQQQRVEAALDTPEARAITETLNKTRVPMSEGVSDAITKGVIGATVGPLAEQAISAVAPGVEKGLSDAYRENFEGQTSIAGLSQLPYMAVGAAEGAALRGVGLVGKGISALAAAQGVEGAIQNVEQIAGAENSQQAAKASAQLLGNISMVGLGALGLRGHTYRFIDESHQLLASTPIPTADTTETGFLRPAGIIGAERQLVGGGLPLTEFGTIQDEGLLRVANFLGAERQLAAPRTALPEFARTTLEPGGPPPKALPAPGESTATPGLVGPSPEAPRVAGFRIELPPESSAAKLARSVLEKPPETEAQQALRDLIKVTDEKAATKANPYQPPVVSVDLRQLQKMMQKNTIGTVENWADKVIQDKLGGASANPYVDPEFLAAAVVKGSALAAKGFTNFAAWADEMGRQYGPAIQPHLATIYKAITGNSPPSKEIPPLLGAKPAANLTGVGSPPVIPPSGAPAQPPIIGQAKPMSLGQKISNGIKGLAGESMPKITTANRLAGEAGVRYASSPIAAAYQARAFSEKVLSGGIDPVKLGAALTEDNLRGRIDELTNQGRIEEADAVQTLIGAKDSPFKTEEQYQAYLKRPDVQAAIATHIAEHATEVEPMFRAAARIDPNTGQLPTRGRQTGARINLFVPDNTTPGTPRASTQPRLTATFQRKTPFAREASGTATYGMDYREIMNNTFTRQLEIANKNIFDDALVSSGNAVIGPPGKAPILAGEPTVAFPLKRTTFVNDNGNFVKADNIYVRESLAKEYIQAANPFGRTDAGKFIGKINNTINKAALIGLTDFVVHSNNLATLLLTRPMSGNIFADTILSAAGRADIPVTIVKTIAKSLQNNTAQLGELAKIGALRQTGNKWLSGRTLEWLDQTVRLVLDDTFKDLAKRGLVDNTETARREFINQAGQYNKRLQGEFVARLRDTGISPFITAGRAFNALGVRNMLLDPGLKGGSALTRASVLAKWVGSVVLLATLNTILSGSPTGRDGVALGRLDTGMTDEDGRPLTLPFLDLIGFGRGLRVTGVKGFAEALRNGLPLQDALDMAARDTINSAISPLAGPIVRLGVGAASGYSPAFGVRRLFPVVGPDENQHFSDFSHALGEANPIIGSLIDLYRSGGSPSEALARQLPRFSLQPGRQPEVQENYAEIVHRARLYTYVDDLISRARRIPTSQREAFVEKELESLSEDDRPIVEQNLHRRKLEY